VTYVISEHSPKRAAALRFGRELAKAMARRDVGSRPVSEAAGTGRNSVRNWLHGRNLPRIETARKLAEVLDTPQLATLAVELRRKACETCGQPFIDDTGADNRRFCGPDCQRVAEKKRLGTTSRFEAAIIAERRLATHKAAVAAYCGSCEPGGRCVTAECKLRPVSPLPLFADRLDIDPVASRKRNRWEGTADQDAARMRGVWAGYSPEERQARIEKAAMASKVARGLVRTDGPMAIAPSRLGQ